MTEIPPPSRDLPPGVHTALRARVLDATYELEAPHRRRWLLPLAAAAAVLVVVFGAIGVLRTAREKPAPVTTAAPVVAPTAFDPRFTRLNPGWLPSGVTVESHGVSTSGEHLRTTRGELWIEIIPRDGRADFGAPLTGSNRRGPLINGLPSVWNPPDDHGRAGWLSWEWAPGAAATMMVVGFGEEIAARIAENLHPGEPRPMALPFRMTPPGNLPLLSRSIALQAPDAFGAGLHFGEGTGNLRSVDVTWLPAKYAAKTYPLTTTVSGRPASVRTEGEYLAVWQRFGADVAEVQCRKQKSGTVEAVRDECLRVAGSLRPAGVNGDPSTWSAKPFA